MNPAVNDIPVIKPAPGASLKFVYPSGSRPLDGYTIKRGIGRGGFGEVYFATSDAGKEVALKLIRRNLEIELRGVQQCLNLKHPNLLALYDIRQDAQGDSWVVMEYVDGASLEDVLARSPHGLPRDEALRWFDGLCGAVAYLHDHGIVHRDLKPENVFCDGSMSDHGIVKLGDYGLSKFISVSRRSGQTESVGTVHYMAPEIANGRYGKEIDIYALGIMLYEMLTGHVPFEGESVGEVLMKHLTAQPDLNRVPELYRAAVESCLAKDPDARPQSVVELREMVLGGDAEQVKGPVSVRSPAAGAKPSPQRKSAACGTWRARFDDYWRKLTPVQQTWHRAGLIILFVSAVLMLSPTLRAATTPVVSATPVGFMTLSLVALAALWGLVIAKRNPSSGPYKRSPVSPRQTAPTEVHQPQVPLTPEVVVSDVSPAPPDMPRSVPESVSRSYRAAVWIRSLLVAAAVSAAASLMLILLRGERPEPELYAWLMLSSTVGAWSVLTVSQLFQSRPVEPTMRRFATALVGLAFGVAAWSFDAALLVDLPYDARSQSLVSHPFYDAGGQPEVFAYMAHFAVLFLIVNWWSQADVRRSDRINIGSVVGAGFIAWMVGWFVTFPFPWSPLCAMAISIAVQMSAPWQPMPRVPRRAGQWAVL